MFAKESAALIERYRMREHFAQVFQLYSGSDDQVVLDAQSVLRLNEHISFQ